MFHDNPRRWTDDDGPQFDSYNVRGWLASGGGQSAAGRTAFQTACEAAGRDPKDVQTWGRAQAAAGWPEARSFERVIGNKVA